jgi:hypothetical protein
MKKTTPSFSEHGHSAPALTPEALKAWKEMKARKAAAANAACGKKLKPAIALPKKKKKGGAVHVANINAVAVRVKIEAPKPAPAPAPAAPATKPVFDVTAKVV